MVKDYGYYGLIYRMKAICQSDEITGEVAVASSFGIARTVEVVAVVAFGEAQGG